MPQMHNIFSQSAPNILKYQDQDFEEMLSLLVDAFASKFCHRQNLTPGDIKQILTGTWDINAGDTGSLHLVAKESERVVGALLVQFPKKHNGQRKRKQRSKREQRNRKTFPLLALCRRYGLFNIFLLTFKLSVLEIAKPRGCYVEHIAVHQSMRGQGIGEKLLSHAEKSLKNMGFSSLSLAVAEGNSAKNLYDRTGFQDICHINSGFKGYFIGINKWIFMNKNLD